MESQNLIECEKAALKTPFSKHDESPLFRMVEDYKTPNKPLMVAFMILELRIATKN